MCAQIILPPIILPIACLEKHTTTLSAPSWDTTENPEFSIPCSAFCIHKSVA